MNYLILTAIISTIIYSLKKDKTSEKKSTAKFLDDEWEPVIPDYGQPERSFSIEISSNSNHPITQKLEAFSRN